MPPTSAEKAAYNAKYAAENRARKGLLDAIRSILAGRKTQPKTLKKYGWTITQVNRIRALDARYKAVLEDTHGVKLDSVFVGTPLPPLDTLRASVQEVPAPAPPPVPRYEQGLVDTPEKGTNTPVTWQQIVSFWQSNPDKNNMGSNSVRKETRNGQLVPAKFRPRTNETKQKTFDLIRKHFGAEWKDNAVPILKRASEVMAFLRAESQKTELQIERDRTVVDSAEGAVAGRGADDDDEISSGNVSRAATVVRARDKSSALKAVKADYSKRLGHIISTMRSWKLFGDAMGTDVLNMYDGTFSAGQLGFKQAKAAVDEAAENRTKNALNAIPSLKLLLSFLPKIKDKFGAGSTTYLACFLQVRLWGLRDNLGGIEIRDTDGSFYDPAVGEESRKDWYNRRTGQLYISHFKTQDSSAGKPYDFLLKGDVKQAVDDTLAPGAPQPNRVWLVGVGVGKKHKDRAGLPLPVGAKISSAFAAVGLTYMTGRSGELKPTAPGPNDIRHSQVVDRYEDFKRKDPSLTEDQISKKIAAFFNHSAEISKKYLRKTFDSLDSPLATKKGLGAEGEARGAAPAALSPIEEESGESSGPGGGAAANAPSGRLTWGAKGPRSARKPRQTTWGEAAPPAPAPEPTPAPKLRRSPRMRRAPERR